MVGSELMSVQDHWNAIENILINTIDNIAPLISVNPKLKNTVANSGFWKI